MSHTITLQIPDSVYRPLVERAEREGRTPEEVATDLLALAACEEQEDPLLQLAGALEADVPDLGTKHDQYLREEADGGLGCQDRPNAYVLTS